MIDNREASTGIAKHAYVLTPQGNQTVADSIKNIQGMDLAMYEKLVRELYEKSNEELGLESEHISQLVSIHVLRWFCA